jgi:hypothetical protein
MAISKSDTTVQHSLHSPTWRITRRVHTYTVRRRFCHLYLSRSRSPYLLLNIHRRRPVPISFSRQVNIHWPSNIHDNPALLISARPHNFVPATPISLCVAPALFSPGDGHRGISLSPLTFTDSLPSVTTSLPPLVFALPTGGKLTPISLPSASSAAAAARTTPPPLLLLAPLTPPPLSLPHSRPRRPQHPQTNSSISNISLSILRI